MNNPARQPQHMLPEDMQLTNEYYYSRKHIDGYIRTAITENPETEAKVQHGIELLDDWRHRDYYESKDARLQQLRELNLDTLVRTIFVGIAYCQTPELFVSVTAQLATRLEMDDKRDSILTIAEMVAVLCATDAFDITKASAEASLMIESRIPLPVKLMDAIARSLYLPPMVCEPKELTTNFQSPYLTHNDCLILGKQNAHADDICLDVINLQNRIPLKLSVEFLSSVEEEPTFELDSMEKARLWRQFKEQSYEVYRLLIRQGNRFWLTHKVDKRGRLYAQGYHITPQGSAFKKAMIELADEEMVEGVPDGYQQTPTI